MYIELQPQDLIRQNLHLPYILHDGFLCCRRRFHGSVHIYYSSICWQKITDSLVSVNSRCGLQKSSIAMLVKLSSSAILGSSLIPAWIPGLRLLFDPF